MAKEYEFPLSVGSLYYEKIVTEHAGEGLCITRLQGLAGEVEIPAQIEGTPVLAIGRKAFLSKKNLRKVTVPETVVEVGDWAFAYCDNLHTVRFLAAKAGSGEEAGEQAEHVSDSGKEAELRFGKAVFLECHKLRYVFVQAQEESTAALLAAAVTTAEAPYLLDAQEAGSAEWLEKWDARMLSILHSADDEGYSKQVLCGEEDYGSTDKVAYESGRRKVKVRLLLLRCMYPEGLKAECRSEMEEYLRAHTKPGTGNAQMGARGNPSRHDNKNENGIVQDETWQVILKEHSEERAFYTLFTDLGCVTRENFDALLSDVGEDCPELRAYLMRYKEEKLGYADVFADFLNF